MAALAARDARATSWRPLQVGTVVVALLLLAVALLATAPWLGPRGRAAALNDVQPAVNLVSALLLLRRATAATALMTRLAWALPGAGWLLVAVGDGIWSYYGLPMGTFGTPADPYFVLGGVAVVSGLVLFAAQGQWRLSRTRLLLDALVLASAVTLIAFMFFLEEMFASLGSGPEAVFLAFFPLADVVIISTIVVLLFTQRASRARRPDLVLIALGSATMVLGDAAIAAVSLGDSLVPEAVADLPYFVAPLFMALAALAPVDAGPRLRPPRRGAALLPDLAVLAALVTCLLQGIGDWVDGVLAALTLALAVTRQVSLDVENLRLRRDLEARVAARTAEAEGLAQRHRRILQSVGEGIVGIDAGGLLSFANATAERLVGAAPGSLVGQDVCVALQGAIGPEVPGCPLAIALTEQRTVTRDDLELTRGDGTRFAVELTATPHRDSTDPTIAVVVFRDITERRATEKIKSEFVAVVSHELRTPLTSIRGSLELLADGDVGDLSPAVARMIDVARRGSERLTLLINDILLVERLDSGSLPVHLTPEPAGPLTENATAALVPIAGLGGIDLRVESTPCTLHVDADRYTQVITNLVGNAIKFTPRGGTVVVGITAQDHTATVHVTDTGRGIPADDLEAVFDRFHQVSAEDRHVGAGTGLGLAITRSIVEAHGGRIWVESQVGVGSTFSFTMPLADPAPPPDLDPPEPHHAASAAPSRATSSPPSSW